MKPIRQMLVQVDVLDALTGAFDDTPHYAGEAKIAMPVAGIM